MLALSLGSDGLRERAAVRAAVDDTARCVEALRRGDVQAALTTMDDIVRFGRMPLVLQLWSQLAADYLASGPEPGDTDGTPEALARTLVELTARCGDDEADRLLRQISALGHGGQVRAAHEILRAVAAPGGLPSRAGALHHLQARALLAGVGEPGPALDDGVVRDLVELVTALWRDLPTVPLICGVRAAISEAFAEPGRLTEAIIAVARAYAAGEAPGTRIRPARPSPDLIDHFDTMTPPTGRTTIVCCRIAELSNDGDPEGARAELWDNTNEQLEREEVLFRLLTWLSRRVFSEVAACVHDGR